MKVEYKDAKLTLDFFSIMDLIPDEQKIDLIESLSCEGAIIKHVADQIVYGCTENGCYGSKNCGFEATTPLDKATKFIAENANDVAKKTISSLTRLIALKEEIIDGKYSEIRKLNERIMHLNELLHQHDISI